MEYNLVEIWLRKDPIRWVAGMLAGLFAGAVALGVSMMICSANGIDPWLGAKLIGTTVLGASATDSSSMQGAFTGGVVFEALCMFLGFIFAHFTGTNSIKSLLAMGLVWGTFAWIFIWNLFLQSFRPIFAARIPSAAAFPICIAFGLTLAVVSVFDSILRGGKRA